MKIIVDKMPEYPYECRNCRLENDEFWYNIRLNNRYVLTYSNGGDVGEESILFKLTDEQADLFKKYGCREINSYEFAIST